MAFEGTARACRRLTGVLSVAGEFVVLLPRVGCGASWLVAFVLFRGVGWGHGMAIIEIVAQF